MNSKYLAIDEKFWQCSLYIISDCSWPKKLVEIEIASSRLDLELITKLIFHKINVNTDTFMNNLLF